MFGIGLICGAAAATAFILYGNGQLLIELAERIRKVADRWQAHDWGRQ